MTAPPLARPLCSDEELIRRLACQGVSLNSPDDRLCVICGRPSRTAECRACAVAEETAWKRASDV